MKLQLMDSSYHHPKIVNKDKIYQTFLQNYEKLSPRELENTLCVSIDQIKEYIPRCVSCLGCRTRYIDQILWNVILVNLVLIIL